MGIRFRNDSTEVSCDRSVPTKFKEGKLLCGCMRTRGHKGACIARSYDAAKADGVCYGCRASTYVLHRKDCHATKMVECAFCQQRFGGAHNYVSYTQGWGCSAVVRDDRLIGGYGSLEHDFETYRFVDGEPVGFENADAVCDGCIRGFMEQGALVKARKPGECWGDCERPCCL